MGSSLTRMSVSCILVWTLYSFVDAQSAVSPAEPMLTTTPTPPPSAASQRAIPDDNLGYPVLITLGNGSSGSGFYVNNAKDVYLVTAKHVFFDPQKNTLIDTHATLLSYSKDPADDSTNLVSLDLAVLNKSGDIKANPSHDVVVIRVFTLDAATNGTAILGTPGVRSERTSRAGFLVVSLETIRPFKNVLVGNDVMIFGYPNSIGLQQSPQFDSHRPLLRKGIVAGTDPTKTSIVLDCPSYFGNSGGPVLEVDRDGFVTHFNIIGVISEYIPYVNAASSQTSQIIIYTNSGYSVATPMDFVLQLIK